MIVYTPGPWRLEDNLPEPSDTSIYGPDDELVVAAEMDGWIVPFACRGTTVGLGNARLCAASPRLYEALKQLSSAVFGEQLEDEPNVYEDYDKLIELKRVARLALNQAETGVSE